MESTLRIALPKGRMMEEMVTRLSSMGYEFPGILSTRSLKVASACGGMEALIIRSADVPTYVARGAAELGVVGRDVLLENGELSSNLFELLDLGFGRCRIVVAAPAGLAPERTAVRVATKYPTIAKSIFDASGRAAEIIKLYGSVELAPAARLADVIVDIVETGGTLKANELEVVEECGVSTARLIANRAAYKIQNDRIRSWVAMLEKTINPMETQPR